MFVKEGKIFDVMTGGIHLRWKTDMMKIPENLRKSENRWEGRVSRLVGELKVHFGGLPLENCQTNIAASFFTLKTLFCSMSHRRYRNKGRSCRDKHLRVLCSAYCPTSQIQPILKAA